MLFSPQVRKLDAEEEIPIISRCVQKWTGIGRTAGQTDVTAASKAINHFYSSKGSNYPLIAFCTSPLAALVACEILHHRIRNNNKTSAPRELETKLRLFENIDVLPKDTSCLEESVLGLIDNIGDTYLSSPKKANDRPLYLNWRPIFPVPESSFVDVSALYQTAIRVTELVSSQIDARLAPFMNRTFEGAFRAAFRSPTEIRRSPAISMNTLGGVEHPGSWNVSLLAANDTYNEVAGLEFETEQFAIAHGQEIALQVPIVWTFERIAIACMRPLWVDVDQQGRPHSASRAAIQFPDDTCLYAWHGRRVPGELINNPESINVSQIESESNTEVKRAMLEIYGWSRFMQESGAELLDEAQDQLGNPLLLWRRNVPRDEPILMLEMVNSTPEPDGRLKHYMIRVPPSTDSAKQAQAWICGIDDAESIEFIKQS